MNPTTIFFSIIPVFLGMFFFLVGGLVCFSGVRSRQLENASRSWPSIPGQVTSAEMKVETINFRTRLGGPSTDYRPLIRYEYVIEGIRYQNDQITFGAIKMDKANAEAKLASYPVGSTVTVYYNPKKPDQAVLEHTDTGSILFILVGAVGLVIGLCVVCFGIALIASFLNTAK